MTTPSDPQHAMFRQGTSDDVTVLSAMLARAFSQDPFWRWMVAGRRDTHRALTRGFSAQLRHLALPQGHVQCEVSGRAAALWSPPGSWAMGWREQLLFVPDFMAIVGLRRILPVLWAIQTVQAWHPEAPHYYLQVLGTDPRDQGKGLASGLLRQLLATADASGFPVYLETAEPFNPGFYRRHGFEVMREARPPGGAPPLWLMQRSAQQ